MNNHIAGMIFHPPNLGILDETIEKLFPYLFPVYKKLGILTKKKILEKSPAFHYFRIDNICSKIGSKSDFIGIMLPLLPEQFLSLERENVNFKIFKAIKLAKSLHAEIITLGAFTSIVSNQGEDFGSNPPTHITSGNTYTAALCLQSIFQLVEKLNLSLSDLNIGIVGATGNIGSACARTLSRVSKKIILNSRTITNEDRVIKELDKKCSYEIIRDAKEVIARSDIIICATSSTTKLFDYLDFKPGAILCDISIPANIAKGIIKHRNDVIAYEGGRGKIFNYNEIKNDKWRVLFPTNSIYGCLLESLILSFENRIESYSIGRKMISEDKMNEIYNLGLKHGISVADPQCDGYVFTSEDFNRVRSFMKRN
jgi:fatty aldehyde-generating acyl-ACP reductase